MEENKLPKLNVLEQAKEAQSRKMSDQWGIYNPGYGSWEVVRTEVVATPRKLNCEWTCSIKEDITFEQPTQELVDELTQVIVKEYNACKAEYPLSYKYHLTMMRGWSLEMIRSIEHHLTFSSTNNPLNPQSSDQAWEQTIDTLTTHAKSDGSFEVEQTAIDAYDQTKKYFQ